jgi:insertion element IS1 protein InsB
MATNTAALEERFGSVSKVEMDCDCCHTGPHFIVSLRKEWPMTFIAVRCPHCQSDQIVKRGKTARGTQRYLCQNTLCVRGSFLLDSCNRGCLPEVKQTIIDMSLNASGVRDTARSLHICPNTVLRELKKKATALESVNTALLRTLNPAEVAWDVERAGEAEAEMDEMWSFVGHKGNPRWLWHAIDHHTGKVLAYVFGRRKDDVFLQLKARLEPFGLTRYSTDHWGAYTRHLDPDEHCPGKRNTQKIERKHLTLRTRMKRLVRKTICFSKTTQMHDIVIGLFVNRYAFGRAV